MAKVSIVIPARNEQFLQPTIEDLFKKATGEIEVIAMLDNYWPDPAIKDHPNLTIVHSKKVIGMRELINGGARIATGKYLMKIDAHCMVGPGFDEIMQKSCGKDSLIVPSRYSLDAENWRRMRDKKDRIKQATEYLFMTYPYNTDSLYGTGLHGRKWKGEGGLEGGFYHMENKHKDKKIDEILTFQGSCWFMHKDKFFEIDCLDSQHYNFHQEAQELGFKVWLGGGEVLRDKNTWYAHLHKGKQYGRGFKLSKRLMIESEIFSTDFWMNNRLKNQVHDLKWLIDKFWPLDGWPEDWYSNPKYAEEYEHIGLK